jgi:hypothetical protein
MTAAKLSGRMPQLRGASTSVHGVALFRRVTGVDLCLFDEAERTQKGRAHPRRPSASRVAPVVPGGELID